MAIKIITILTATIATSALSVTESYVYQNAENIKVDERFATELILDKNFNPYIEFEGKLLSEIAQDKGNYALSLLLKQKELGNEQMKLSDRITFKDGDPYNEKMLMAMLIDNSFDKAIDYIDATKPLPTLITKSTAKGLSPLSIIISSKDYKGVMRILEKFESIGVNFEQRFGPDENSFLAESCAKDNPAATFFAFKLNKNNPFEKNKRGLDLLGLAKENNSTSCKVIISKIFQNLNLN